MKWWWQLKKSETDLEREVRSDLQLEEEEQQEKGLPPEEARHAAKRAFGNEPLSRNKFEKHGVGCHSKPLRRMFDMRSDKSPGIPHLPR